MNNLILSTKNIDDLIGDIANEVVNRLEQYYKDQNNSIDQDHHLMTVTEAAEFLRLSTTTIYRLASKGDFPSLKRSKRLYFMRRDLLHYLEEGRKQTNADNYLEVGEFFKKKKKLI